MNLHPWLTKKLSKILSYFSFIEIVTCLTVTNDGSIVVIDSVVPTVYFMSEDGAIISWFRCGTNVIEPSDVAIRGAGFM